MAAKVQEDFLCDFRVFSGSKDLLKNRNLTSNVLKSQDTA